MIRDPGRQEQAVLTALRTHWRTYHGPPTQRQLATLAGCSVSTVNATLNRLAQQGLVIRQGGKRLPVLAQSQDTVSLVAASLCRRGFWPADVLNYDWPQTTAAFFRANAADEEERGELARHVRRTLETQSYLTRDLLNEAQFQDETADTVVTALHRALVVFGSPEALIAGVLDKMARDELRGHQHRG